MTVGHLMNHCTVPTHRCTESLKNRASIRCGNGVWFFMILTYDCEYGTHYLRFVSTISYCPYCGKKLTVDDKETGE